MVDPDEASHGPSVARHRRGAPVATPFWARATGSPAKQIHDFNGGVFPSGLFWTVALPDDSFRLTDHGTRARLEADDVPVIDTFQFATNPYLVAATVSLRSSGMRRGPVETLSDGTTFAARLASATATGSFSGGELGFAFEASGSSSHHGYAEIGTEQNGVFR